MELQTVQAQLEPSSSLASLVKCDGANPVEMAQLPSRVILCETPPAVPATSGASLREG